MTRSKWLDYQPVTEADRIAELVVRHHLGEFRDRPAVQRRLDELFTVNPDNAPDLLLRACGFLSVTGHDLERLADLAVQRKTAPTSTPLVNTPRSTLREAHAHAAHDL